MYDVRAIANWFLERASENGEQLTAMKLQKLVYVAHGWNLAFLDEPLVLEPVEAWKWGPVFRSLYREFRDFGSMPIDRRATAFDGANLEEREVGISDFTEGERLESTRELLSSVWDAYGNYTAAQLSDITHRQGTPWHDMYEKMQRQIKPFTVIPNELIKQHYQNLLNERTAAAN